MQTCDLFLECVICDLCVCYNYVSVCYNYVRVYGSSKRWSLSFSNDLLRSSEPGDILLLICPIASVNSAGRTADN